MSRHRQRLEGRAAPRSILDLAAPAWKGRAAMANPLFGTTTIHVAALFATWGPQRARKFLEDVRANDVRIASSNGEVKRLVVAGEVAFGLTDTDDAHAAVESGAAVDVVYPDQTDLGTLVMPTTLICLGGGPHPAEARAAIDFLLSPEVEQRLAESAAHMPLRKDVATPPNVKTVAGIRAMQLDYSRVAEQMESIQPWLREWTGF